VLDGFFDSSHTNLIEAWQHQCWDAPKDRLAFHLFFIEIKHQETWKIARFSVTGKRSFWHMSHTGAWWIFRFQPYKPNRSLTTSMLRCSKRQIGFSFVFHWNQASGNMKIARFECLGKRSFWHMSHTVAGSIQPLPVLTTALKKARETGSVTVVAVLLFFEF
jgi:hypothetical protein